MTREEFLALASSKYDSIRDLNKLDNFYDYEKELYSSLYKKVFFTKYNLIFWVIVLSNLLLCQND